MLCVIIHVGRGCNRGKPKNRKTDLAQVIFTHRIVREIIPNSLLPSYLCKLCMTQTVITARPKTRSGLGGYPLNKQAVPRSKKQQQIRSHALKQVIALFYLTNYLTIPHILRHTHALLSVCLFLFLQMFF